MTYLRRRKSYDVYEYEPENKNQEFDETTYNHSSVFPKPITEKDNYSIFFQ